jgi:hypothetical protein
MNHCHSKENHVMPLPMWQGETKSESWVLVTREQNDHLHLCLEDWGIVGFWGKVSVVLLCLS